MKSLTFETRSLPQTLFMSGPKLDLLDIILIQI